ncbi:unnamed protein product [Microthlaspi erraticum]|uniref:Uncharacterized protein n=1 Tax=Microthlaspi erraticum TaxID=1685480 RepID=A0A6D2IVI8_9BRAS|nr:unnamed protein product [Microthlaspi erraticum]
MSSRSRCSKVLTTSGNSVIPQPDKYNSSIDCEGGCETELLLVVKTWLPQRANATSDLKHDKIAFKSIVDVVFKWANVRIWIDLRCEKIVKSTGPWVFQWERSRVSRLTNLEIDLGIGPLKLFFPRPKACS